MKSKKAIEVYMRGEFSKRESKALREKETARFRAILRSLPLALVRTITIPILMRAYPTTLNEKQVSAIRREFLSKQEGIMGKHKDSVMKATQPEELGASLVLEKVARIASKTYAYLGDGEEVAECDAIKMITQELLAYDSSILQRNEKKRLPKQPPRINQ